MIFFLLFAATLQAAPRALVPDQVEKDLGDAVKNITVIEPHEQSEVCECLMSYRGIPLQTVLEQYYPKEWPGFDGEIQIFALDGYLGAVEASKARIIGQGSFPGNRAASAGNGLPI